MSIRAVITDFGGVLVRFDAAPGRRKWEDRLHLAPGSLTSMVFDSEISHRAVVGVVPGIAIWQHIGLRYGLNDESIRQLEEDFWLGEYLDMQLISFLRSLRPQYRIAILSNAWSDARTTFVTKFHLQDEVDTIVISAEERMAKPDIRIYQLAAERIGIRPEQAVFIDDLEENIEGARRAGMHAVHFQDTSRVIEEVATCLNGSGIASKAS